MAHAGVAQSRLAVARAPSRPLPCPPAPLQVPYCPHLQHLFFGEELYQLARMWTSGYDVFAPPCALAAHQWGRGARAATYQGDVLGGGAGAEGAAPAAAGGGGGGACGGAEAGDAPAPAEASGQREQQQQQRRQAQQRVLAVLLGEGGQGQQGEEGWGVGQRWGLGRVRSLQQFVQHLGVDFAQRRALERAVYGGRDPAEFAACSMASSSL
jgi:hypothetical protein